MTHKFYESILGPNLRAFMLDSFGARNFYIHAEMDAYEDETRICSKEWSVIIRRDLV